MHSIKKNFASNGGKTEVVKISISGSYNYRYTKENIVDHVAISMHIKQPDTAANSALNSPKQYDISMSSAEARAVALTLLEQADKADYQLGTNRYATDLKPFKLDFERQLAKATSERKL